MASLYDLTPRQIQVLECAAAGLVAKETAVKLGITENTVKSHMGDIFVKLNAVNIAQAVYIAVNKGILGSAVFSQRSASGIPWCLRTTIHRVLL